MNLSHLSPRSLRRAIAREKKLCANGTLELMRHQARRDALGAELSLRPFAIHPWQSSPGAVIREWRELHGIGPTLATLSKRLRRWKRRHSDVPHKELAQLIAMRLTPRTVKHERV